jgi:hypothetical protein
VSSRQNTFTGMLQMPPDLLNQTLTQLPSSILAFRKGTSRIEAKILNVGKTRKMESLSKRIKQILNFPHLFLQYRKRNISNTIGSKRKCR